MRISSNSLSLLSILLSGLASQPTSQATAQTFRTLYSFTQTPGLAYTNSDGAYPFAGLFLSGNTLYGTAESAGPSGYGTTFSMHVDGSEFKPFLTFSSGGSSSSEGLVVSGQILYGTTVANNYSNGAIFAINTDGSGFRIIHDFSSDGTWSEGNLILSGNTLYGNSSSTNDYGRVFKINTDGTGFTNLYISTDNNGAYGLDGNLVLSSNTLFGVSGSGGTNNSGAIYAVNTDGSGIRIVHNFTDAGGSPNQGTNRDGVWPNGPLVVSGDTLYGTTALGGESGWGTIFSVKTDGTGFRILHTFVIGSPDGTDPIIPIRGLILANNTLYGAAGSDAGSVWGSPGFGSIFAINLDGTGFTILHTFTGGYGGGRCSGLVAGSNTLYGTASGDGDGTGTGWSGNGTIFSISFTPKLTIIASGSNLIVTWPTNSAGFDYTGYTLRSSTNLLSSAWTASSPAPVVVTGQNTVTVPITAAHQFYRLSQ